MYWGNNNNVNTKKKNNYESIDGDTNNTDNTNKAKNVDNGKA